LSRDCRRIVVSGWYQRLFPTRLSRQLQAVPEFETTAQGSRLATSGGGVLTGRGADIIVIDGPLKPEEALSQTQRPVCVRACSASSLIIVPNAGSRLLAGSLEPVEHLGRRIDLVIMPASREGGQLVQVWASQGAPFGRRTKPFSIIAVCACMHMTLSACG
jgi:hypothetical protein